MIVAAIPAFNEERMIAKVIVHAMRHVDKVLVVDDGSNDDTALIAEKLGAIVLKHERNLGKGAAMRTCFEWASKIKTDVIVTLDADGQHDPDEIPEVVKPILNGTADVSVGSRMSGASMPHLRRVGARFLDRVTGVKVGGLTVDAQSGFRAYSGKVLGRIMPADYGMGVDSEILMKAEEAKLRIVAIPISVSYEGPDTSTHNPIFHAVDVLATIVKLVSIRHALLFYGGFSTVMFVVALIFGVQTLDYYAKWGKVVTNLALVSVAAGLLGFLSLFTGIILFTLITVLRERR